MQNDDQALTRKVFQYEKALKMLSVKKRKLSVKLIAMKKSFEELEGMDNDQILHRIGSLVMSRDRLVVMKDTQEEIMALESAINVIDEKFDEGMTELKKITGTNKPMI